VEKLKQSNPNPPARNAYATNPSRQTRYATPQLLTSKNASPKLAGLTRCPANGGVNSSAIDHNIRWWEISQKKKYRVFSLHKVSSRS